MAEATTTHTAFKPENDGREYEPVNAYEELVKTNVTTMMEYMDDMCKCDKCYSDVCALVLNQLSPQYVTTRKGALISQIPQMAQGNHVDLTVKIVSALRMVQANPHH